MSKIVSLEQSRREKKEKKARSEMSDADRIKDLEAKVRYLVTLIEELRDTSSANRRLIRRILKGLSSLRPKRGPTT